jgi:hypothetical protein
MGLIRKLRVEFVLGSLLMFGQAGIVKMRSFLIMLQVIYRAIHIWPYLLPKDFETLRGFFVCFVSLATGSC